MASQSSSQQEAEALKEELTKLDYEIDVLATRRAETRRRVNQFCASTSRLAIETLSMIFDYVCDLPTTAPIDDDYQPVKLGSVSVHWRQVAHSTPSIWNRLCIHLKNAGHVSSKTFSLMQLYVKNLANQSISLRLDLSEEDRTDDSQEQNSDSQNGEQPVSVNDSLSFDPESIVPITTIFQFITQEHPTKLQRLYINEFSLEYLPLFIGNIDPSVGLPNLEKIHIAWYQGVPDGHDWGNDLTPLPFALIPRLTEVSLGQNSPGFTIPYNQLTDINLEYIAIDRCLEIMVLCPMVTECHIFYPSPPSDWEKEPPSTSVTLSHTTCLGWAFGFQKWDVAFLKHFTFPALKRFRCEDQGEDGIQLDLSITDQDRDVRRLQRDFLSRCPRLTVYERAAQDFTHWEIVQLCDDLPDTVEELYLRNVEVVEATKVNARLTRGGDWTMDIFPRLKVLELQGNFWYNMTTVFPSLVNMLESRVRALPDRYKDQARLEEFNLKWDTDNEIPPQQLTGKQKAGLQHLVNEGLRVTTSNAKGEDTIWSPAKYRPPTNSCGA